MINNVTKKGFTLVELAIVLVIIGLLVGGVLAGQELIAQAKIKKAVSVLKDIDIGNATFISKYNSIPGDYRRYAEFGMVNNQSGNANSCDVTASWLGDKHLDCIGTWFSISGEMANFFLHMSNIGMIKGSYTNNAPCGYGSTFTVGTELPATPFSAVYAVTVGGTLYKILGKPSANGTFLNNLLSYGADNQDTWVTAGNPLTPEQAYGIDKDIDDGRPLSGSVRVMHSMRSGITPNSDMACGDKSLYIIHDTNDNATNCVYNGEYNLSYQEKSCSLSIR